MTGNGAATGTETTEGFEPLLQFLCRTHGFDFTGYKRTTLIRRVRRRVEEVGLATFTDYQARLEAEPQEFASLFDTILINATGFFRDAQSWQYLSEAVVPRILESRRDGGQIRVWSAGCAAGQEAYTLAIIFAEALGRDAFRERVRIYATDVDENALAQARLAIYSLREVSAVAQPLREKYFTFTGTRATFNPEFRRCVMFGRHDLVRDAPISRLDLLVCRNTLMYLTTETQARVFTRFHYALTDLGFLFLGRAEMLVKHGDLFSSFDVKHRISTKVPRPEVIQAALHPEREAPPARRVPFADLALDLAPVAMITVDADLLLRSASREARRIFGLTAIDIGRRLQDLELSYRPTDLRSALDEVRQTGKDVIIPDVERTSSEGTRYFQVHIVPVIKHESGYLGATVSFIDVSAARQLYLELRSSKEKLDIAYQELQSGNEELETTNEELQSTVEELETTNEELQSANEELETMNEELQSANGQLQAINVELRERSAELDQVSFFQQSVLSSLNLAMVVVDRDRHVQIWDGRAQDLWGLQSREVVGRRLDELDSGMPVEAVEGAIAAIFADPGATVDLTVRGVNRRGQNFDCRIVATPITNTGHEPEGVVILMEEVGK